jgi:hypothetical protein
MKKLIYIFSWVLLGFLLSLLAHAGIEVWYINYLLSSNSAPVDFGAFGHYCALSLFVQYGLLLAGLVSGFIAGKFFWRVVYIERKRQ